MYRLFGRVRPWLAPVAVILSLSAAVPPVGSYARQYAFAQAIQFVIFALVSPALFVLGWPSRLAAPVIRMVRRSRPDVAAPSENQLVPADAGQRATREVVARLLPLLALVIIWRLPAVLGALSRHPALTAAELLTLFGAGAIVWLGLVPGQGSQATLSRPMRAAMATAAMWTIWAIAYITGMSRIALAAARDVGPLAVMGAAVDRQIAVAIMWAVPGLCFVPVVYAMLMPWIGDREDSGKARRPTPDGHAGGQGPSGPGGGPRNGTVSAQPSTALANLASPPRPPRGWRPSGG